MAEKNGLKLDVRIVCPSMSAARLIALVEDPTRAVWGKSAVHIVYVESARFNNADVAGWASVVFTLIVEPPLGPLVKMSYSM